VGNGAVTHPADQRLLDLHDGAALDATVGQHPVGGEAEAEPADQHLARRGHQVERGAGQGLLAGELGVVHDEDAVGPQLEHGGGALLTPLAQHQGTAPGLGAGDLDVLHRRLHALTLVVGPGSDGQRVRPCSQSRRRGPVAVTSARQPGSGSVLPLAGGVTLRIAPTAAPTTATTPAGTCQR
jgi:hypothetical protein